MTALLFICMGNICRSPLAHAVMERLVAQAGLSGQITVDSAGTHGYHVGSPPDERSVAVGQRFGYDLTPQRCREVQPEDFETFDYLLVMDHRNLRDLKSFCPEEALWQKVHLLLDFSQQPLTETEVPDPYYGGPDGFEYVLKLVEAGCEGLLTHLQPQEKREEKRKGVS